MRNVFYAKVGRIGSIQIYQLPLTKEWLRGQENHNTSILQVESHEQM